MLARRLRAVEVDVDELAVIARTGWTTDELAGAIDTAQYAGLFDLVRG